MKFGADFFWSRKSISRAGYNLLSPVSADGPNQSLITQTSTDGSKVVTLSSLPSPPHPSQTNGVESPHSGICSPSASISYANSSIPQLNASTSIPHIGNTSNHQSADSTSNLHLGNPSNSLLSLSASDQLNNIPHAHITPNPIFSMASNPEISIAPNLNISNVTNTQISIASNRHSNSSSHSSNVSIIPNTHRNIAPNPQTNSSISSHINVLSNHHSTNTSPKLQFNISSNHHLGVTTSNINIATSNPHLNIPSNPHLSNSSNPHLTVGSNSQLTITQPNLNISTSSHNIDSAAGNLGSVLVNGAAIVALQPATIHPLSQSLSLAGDRSQPITLSDEHHLSNHLLSTQVMLQPQALSAADNSANLIAHQVGFLVAVIEIHFVLWLRTNKAFLIIYLRLVTLLLSCCKHGETLNSFETFSLLNSRNLFHQTQIWITHPNHLISFKWSVTVVFWG